MCRWSIGWSIALLLGFAVSFEPASAQQGQGAELESELAQLNARIGEADQLLQQAQSGGYLVNFGMGAVVVTRDQLHQWATEQVYRDGTGMGDLVVPGQQIAAWLRQAISGNAARLEFLRRARQDDVTRRQAVQSELARMRGASASAGTSQPRASGGCGFPHSWGVRMATGSANLSVDASGNVAGLGNMAGTATLAGNRLTLIWSTRSSGGDQWAGRFVVTLDGSCSGTGELILDTRPAGAEEFGLRGGPVMFTSRGGAGPS